MKDKEIEGPSTLDGKLGHAKLDIVTMATLMTPLYEQFSNFKVDCFRNSQKL